MVMGSLRQEAELVVVGGGPGGYVAAIRAADLGREVIVVEERERLGGVCLLEGCIPSKALISAVELINTAREAKRMGITFEELKVDRAGLRGYTESVIGTLTKGIESLFKRRGIEVVHGRARLDAPGALTLEGAEVSGIDFEHCILATGSTPVTLPGLDDLRLWTSREALELSEIPDRLLVVGGGYIGLELGLVYAGLGSKVTCVELLPQLLAGADPELASFVARSCKKRFERVLLGAKVVGVERAGAGGAHAVKIEAKGEVQTEEFDRVLVSVGRRPNTSDLGLERAGVELDGRGLIVVDEAQRTSARGIYAIGDITPGPALAHKASREGKVAAEVIAGKPAAFDNVSVPAVVFTDPELAWVGITEPEAVADGRAVRVGRFPLAALGRARTLGRTDGLCKVIADPDSGLVLGVGVVGPHASELIAEAALALEMGATLEDIGATIHPHPTLSEAIGEAAEVAANLGVHVYPPGGK